VSAEKDEEGEARKTEVVEKNERDWNLEWNR